MFDTGIEEIDNLAQESHVFPVTMAVGGTGTYIVGEQVEQTYTPAGGSPVTVTARVAEWHLPSRTLRLTYINGVLQQNIALVGEDSGASWNVSTFSTIDFDIDNYDNAENRWYENKADEILDFNEGNPFGEYGDMGVF